MPLNFNFEHGTIGALQAGSKRSFERSGKNIAEDAKLRDTLRGRRQNLFSAFGKTVVNRLAIERGHNHPRLDAGVGCIAIGENVQNDDLAFHIPGPETDADALVFFAILPLLRRTETRVRVV